MPMVDGKKYPYTAAGKKAAAKAGKMAKAKGYMEGGSVTKSPKKTNCGLYGRK